MTNNRQPRRALLTAKEAAGVLSISPRLLWSLTASGEIPCVRIRRAVRYDSDDLDKWIQEHKYGRKK